MTTTAAAPVLGPSAPAGTPLPPPPAPAPPPPPPTDSPAPPVPKRMSTNRLILRCPDLPDAPTLAASIRANREALARFMPWARIPPPDTMDEEVARQAARLPAVAERFADARDFQWLIFLRRRRRGLHSQEQHEEQHEEQQQQAQGENGERDEDVNEEEEGPFVGCVGLHRVPRLADGGADRGWHIGYWIDAEHQRHGYAPEAVRAVADAAFGRTPSERPADLISRTGERLEFLSRVEIWCAQDNEPSAAVARKVGFRLLGVEPFGYEDIDKEIAKMDFRFMLDRN
ncbi:acyl-CoA N-acyltransferase [Zopfochytrium polystomum]|nr:acyl-CoA N-acyltransferase [Zopfochytrium polystomum]